MLLILQFLIVLLQQENNIYFLENQYLMQKRRNKIINVDKKGGRVGNFNSSLETQVQLKIKQHLIVA